MQYLEWLSAHPFLGVIVLVIIGQTIIYSIAALRGKDLD
jgi:hypothetical protein